jgi:hypothetical protein
MEGMNGTASHCFIGLGRSMCYSPGYCGDLLTKEVWTRKHCSLVGEESFVKLQRSSQCGRIIAKWSWTSEAQALTCQGTIQGNKKKCRVIIMQGTLDPAVANHPESTREGRGMILHSCFSERKQIYSRDFFYMPEGWRGRPDGLAGSDQEHKLSWSTGVSSALVLRRGLLGQPS